MSTQLVFVCDRHEVATDSNSEVPAWPVQDAGGHWHYEAFPGQRVAYTQRDVNFAVQVAAMPAAEVAALDMDDLPSDVYFTGSEWFREVAA
jgi:hypothetical protein